MSLENTSNSAGKVFDIRTKYTTDTWLTPLYIIKALGDFNLDPCSPINRPWDTATHHYTEKDDGLIKPWSGRVWLNPPYGKQSKYWLKKLVHHGNGIALIFARTETTYYHDYVWQAADAVFFFQGRIKFLTINGFEVGSPTAPSCLVAYGQDNVEAIQGAIKNGEIRGRLVDLHNVGGEEVQS